MSSMHDIRSSCEEIVTTMLVITIMFVIMESPKRDINTALLKFFFSSQLLMFMFRH